MRRARAGPIPGSRLNSTVVARLRSIGSDGASDGPLGRRSDWRGSFRRRERGGSGSDEVGVGAPSPDLGAVRLDRAPGSAPVADGQTETGKREQDQQHDELAACVEAHARTIPRGSPYD